MTECPEIERTHAMADGELSGAEAEAARAHVVDCAICQGELTDLMQLGAAVADAGPAQRANVVSMAWYRRKRTLFAGGVVMAAAAAATLLVVTRGPSETVTAPVQMAALELAASRQTEVRLAWSGASGYRPYDVQRGAEAHETIALSALAELEKRGDLRGVAMAYLLNGDAKQAKSYLERAKDATLDDQTAVALATGEPERALTLADLALEKEPANGVAQWNRALALRDLGLGRAAAAQWRTLAERKETGWAAEATDRAAKIDREMDARSELVKRVIAHGAGGLTVDDARELPGLSRLYFYDALRIAPSADAITKLAPVAEALDASTGSKDPTAALARVAAADFGKRAPLAATYAEILGGKLPDRVKYLAALRAAKADDLLIGALVKLGANGGRDVLHEDIAELQKLTTAATDPWMKLLGAEQTAIDAIKRHELTDAEVAIQKVRGSCTIPYRCARLEMLVAEPLMGVMRIAEARTALASAWKTAHRAGEMLIEEILLRKLAVLAVQDDATGGGLSLVRAYTDELHLRAPDNCDHETTARQLTALVYLNRLDAAKARAELARSTCPIEASLPMLFTRAQILRAGASDAEVAALRADIAKFRADSQTTVSAKATLDSAEGRLLIEHDPKTATELLRRAIATSRELPGWDADGQRAGAYSYAVLVLAAAKANDAAGVVALLAEEARVPAPTGCLVGVAVDDDRRLAVVRGAGGALALHYDETRRDTSITPETMIPADLVGALTGCDHVDVLARAPLHGTPRLLPDAIAWRYVSPRKSPVGPAGAKSVLVADAEPPASLGLPRLAAWKEEPGAILIAGAAATPSNVLAAIADAGDVVIDVHGLVDLPGDASFLALSSEMDGRYALTASMVRNATLRGNPLVVLAACHGSHGAAVMHEPWSLPAAFVHAGARAVIASPEPMPDRDASVFFAELRTRIHTGVPITTALRDVKATWLSAGRGTWVRDLVVFE